MFMPIHEQPQAEGVVSLTLMTSIAMNVFIPAGTASAKSCISGTAPCSCRSTFSPTASCGPFMYSYCSMFTNSCSPFWTPAKNEHECLIVYLYAMNWWQCCAGC